MVIALLITACLSTASAQENTWLCQRDGDGTAGAAGSSTSRAFWSITRWNEPENRGSHRDARAEGYIDSHTLTTCQKDQNDDSAGRVGAGCLSEDGIESPHPAEARPVGNFITAQFGWPVGWAEHFVIDVDYGWSQLCSRFYSTGIVFEVPRPIPQQAGGGSPILIPLTESPSFELSDLAGGVLFDVDGDGDKDQVAWPLNGHVALLAYDRDGDGVISSGYELFGNYTVPGKGNGFSALGTFVNRERNSSWVTQSDEVFSKLVLWTDSNRDGVSQPEELQSAGNVVEAIALQYRVVGEKDKHGNEFRYRGAVKFVGSNGQRPIYDVCLLTQFTQ